MHFSPDVFYLFLRYLPTQVIISKTSHVANFREQRRSQHVKYTRCRPKVAKRQCSAMACITEVNITKS